MLTKETVIDKIEVIASGCIQVRTADYILEDGAIISGPAYHRHTLNPGDDVSAEDSRVQAVTSAVWTQDVIDTYQAVER